jgi:hypothetical protein
MSMGSREYGFEFHWRRMRRQKRRWSGEVEALVNAGDRVDVLGCLGELEHECRRGDPAGPGYERYSWGRFEDAAGEVRQHAVCLEHPTNAGAGRGA